MKKGFTLIELLIVISIIGILAVALLPNIISAPASARDAGRKAALNGVLSALEQYKAANGQYPAASSGCLPTSLQPFFKGGTLPVGAKSAAASDAAFGCTPGAANTDTQVAYCPLTTTTGGYSYIVAIRMESKLTGNASTSANNILKPATAGTSAPEIGIACPSSFTVAGVNAVATDNSYWYYQVQ